MASKAVFGKPETGGVVLTPPNEEPAEKRMVKVRGYVLIRIDIEEEFESDGDEDQILEEALDRAGVNQEIDDDRLRVYYPEDRFNRDELQKVLRELEAWRKGEPIKGEV
jgi:hypothetical protein